MPASKPPEFRRRALDLVDQGEPVALVARNLGISESCLRRWMDQDAVDSGRKEGLTSAEQRDGSWSSCAARTGCWRWRSRSSSAPAPTSPGRTSSQNEVRLVRELAGDGIDVAVACRVLKVSRSGYYEWVNRLPSARTVEDARLTETIRRIHYDSRCTYRAPRVHAELRMGLGLAIGRKRVSRLMRQAGIRGICHRRKTRGWKPAPATHTDLVQRRFSAEAPDRVWFTDITQHRAGDGWVYCCAVLDAFSRRVVGWSIADHIRTELVVDALEMARWQRRPEPRCHRPRRQGNAIHLVGLRPPAPRSRSARLDGPDRLQHRQRPHRVVLVDHATRTPRPPRLGQPGRTRRGDLRVDRGLVQPHPTPQLAGHALSALVREPSHRRTRSGMITTPFVSGNRVRLRGEPLDPPVDRDVIDRDTTLIE